MLKNLKLERPMAFIDLETTSNRYYVDRIIEFSVLKIWPDGTEEYKSRRVNPQMPIAAEATSKHGITNSDLKGEPTFRQLAKGICEFLEGCDLSGFNILEFDLPLLEHEFERAGIEFSRDNRQIADSMAIFHMREPYDSDNPRNLKAAYQKYCGKELTNAHSADSDVKASAEVLDGQLEMYGDLPCDAKGLCAVCLKGRENYIDIEGKLVWVDGEAVCNFSKDHKGHRLKDIAEENPGFLSWILDREFSPQVKDIASKALGGEFPQME
ncbi:exonuclease domain-containing protein [Chloroflexota bacterium]